MLEHRPGMGSSNAAGRRRRFEVVAPQRRCAAGRPAGPWFDDETRLRVAALVVRVLAADEGLTRREHTFVRWMARKLGLSSHALRGVAIGDLETEFRRLPGSLRYLALQLAIGLVTAEGEVRVAQRSRLETLAGQLGLSPDFVEARIARALERPEPRRAGEVPSQSATAETRRRRPQTLRPNERPS